jgi:hypothetical protein
MAFNASECAFEGFRVVRKHPAAFAIWCLFYLLAVIVIAGAVLATMAPLILQFAHPAAAQGAPFGAPFAAPFAAPAQVAAVFQHNLPILLVGAVVMIPLGMIWSAMTACAIFRAVLRPDEKAFGYLRLGADEFRIIGLYLQIFVLFLAVGLAGAVAIVAVEAAAGKGAGAVLGFLLLGLLALLAYVFVGVRLSLCGPQTFAERRIDLFGSWRVTRGHFWGLFGMYLLLVVFLIGFGIVNTLLQLPFRGLSAQVAHGDVSGLPMLIGGGLLYAIIAFVFGMLEVVVLAAPRAAAYRDLVPPKPEPAARAFA